MSNVARNLTVVRGKIKNAYLKRPADRQNREPRLVAVSKTKSADLVIEAYNCGQRHFGENYIQEIVEKSFDEEILKVCPDIKWHFIGHLQRNKVNKLLTVPNLFIIETVDNEKLAQALHDRVGNFRENPDDKLNVFVQVNTSGEEAKSGCSPQEVVELVKYISDKCPRLSVKGLMTIGKYDNDVGDANPDFLSLIECRERVCRELGFDVNEFELSMGMSNDFEEAVELGATNVRVGSMIFGKRKPYQVLIDGTICMAALKYKVDIQEQFPKYLEGDAKLLTTQCIVREVEKLGSATFGALLILKKFGFHHCGHGKSPVGASECLLQMVGENNPSRYIIATQDVEVQEKCRKIPGAALLYLHARTPVLEPPSTFSQESATEKTVKGFGVSELDKKKLNQLKGEETEEQKTKKRKRKGGPNPLSCLKKKRKVEECPKSDPKKKKKKKKRNRNRLVKKIRKEVLANLNP